MNPTPENETETIRSDIETTRRRMDETMDALGERFQGRHLLDEVLGYFRRGSERGREIGQSLTHSASNAVHAVTDTVKAHPLPFAIIGAGVAWMIYETRRKHRASDEDYEGYDTRSFGAGAYRDPDEDALYDRPLDYPASAATHASTESGYSASGVPNYAETDSGSNAGSKLASAKDKVLQKTSAATQRVRDTLSGAGSRVQDTARQTYSRSRDRVVRTANDYPLGVGIACLAAGVLVGLALPRSKKVDELAGPSVDRLRDRAREAGSELVEKGQRVAHAAAEAAKDEANAQGLTPEKLREEAKAVATSAKDAAASTARAEGLPGSTAPSSSPA
ncbi:MAG TPA: DUF3618 domain-containing protein [Opitutus sp.]|nr:DUF3618 domain-containing protein [Opitutus sp.]